MKIKKFKVSKNALFICITVLTLIVICNIAYTKEGDSITKIFGQKQAEILANAGDGVVATIDGEKITKKGFDTYKLFINNGNNNHSDKEILDNIINRQVVYNKALKDGITVTDQEVSDAINAAKETLSSFPEQNAAFEENIKGLNLTDDQYWESVKPTYEKALICGKYKNSLKDKFAKDNNITDKTELETKFNIFYNQHVKDLRNSAKIESTIN